MKSCMYYNIIMYMYVYVQKICVYNYKLYILYTLVIIHINSNH